jgi:hypothetical protein
MALPITTHGRIIAVSTEKSSSNFQEQLVVHHLDCKLRAATSLLELDTYIVRGVLKSEAIGPTPIEAPPVEADEAPHPVQSHESDSSDIDGGMDAPDFGELFTANEKSGPPCEHIPAQRRRPHKADQSDPTAADAPEPELSDDDIAEAKAVERTYDDFDHALAGSLTLNDLGGPVVHEVPPSAASVDERLGVGSAEGILSGDIHPLWGFDLGVEAEKLHLIQTDSNGIPLLAYSLWGMFGLWFPPSPPLLDIR